MVTRETWKRRGSVEDSRNAKGQFISWHRISAVIFAGFTGRKVAVYGTCMINGRRDSRRYEFSGGTGKDLQRAIILAHRIVPRFRFVDVSAREFLSSPFKYGVEGYWTDREVSS